MANSCWGISFWTKAMGQLKARWGALTCNNGLMQEQRDLGFYILYSSEPWGHQDTPQIPNTCQALYRPSTDRGFKKLWKKFKPLLGAFWLNTTYYCTLHSRMVYPLEKLEMELYSWAVTINMLIRRFWVKRTAGMQHLTRGQEGVLCTASHSPTHTHTAEQRTGIQLLNMSCRWALAQFQAMSKTFSKFFRLSLFLFPVRENWDTKPHAAIYNSILPGWMLMIQPH